MNIRSIRMIIFLSIECLTKSTHIPDNTTTITMFIFTTTPSLLEHYIKRRSSVYNLSTNSIENDSPSTFEHSYDTNTFKDVTNLTKTQIKVIMTVVIIIGFIMFIIAVFRFKNACCEQDAHKIQTEIIRHRISQYNEPSSRRGSIGYYTRKYTRASNYRFEEQLDPSVVKNRSSIPVYEQLFQPKTDIILSSLPIESSTTTAPVQSHYVTSNHSDNQHVSIPIKSNIHKSFSTVGITRCCSHHFKDKLPVIIDIFFSSLTIHSIHRQSGRLILCTVPPHILCRPNTVRYSLVFNVHDQRQRRGSTSNRYIKVSSPTLRKLCLPCITARNHRQQYKRSQQINKNKTLKNNQRQIINPSTTENNVIESIQRLEINPKTQDPKSTILLLHSSEYLHENDANQSDEQHQHFEKTSFPTGKIEEKNDEISVEAEIITTEVVSESVLLTLSSPENEITRSNIEDVCDDHTPLLTSELASTIKDSSNRTTRKYSLNAFSSFVRSSNSHPLSSSSTTSVITNNKTAGDNKKNRHSLDLTSQRQVNLSSLFHRNSITQQSKTVCSKTNSANINSQISPTNTTTLPVQYNQSSGVGDSDSSSRTSLIKTKASNLIKPHLRKKSSTITPISSTSSYRKDFMQKIERFRFIDDSASSTTTVTSPVESTDHLNGHQPCNHLITSAIEQFDDYVRSRYCNNDEINSYIDRLNSDILTNGSYSDLNILNSTNDNSTMQNAQVNQQTISFKPVNHFTSQSETNGYRQVIRNSTPIAIPSRPVHPIDNPPIRPTTIITNEYSRSMDFQSINNNHKHHLRKQELSRPNTLINPATIYETSSSSIATLTSVRSSTSLEFDDDMKPSGVLVDDDFLPMSSPVDDHFWDMTATTNNHHKFKSTNKNECFPNVGSSPDIEVKHFVVEPMNKLTSTIDEPFSETSCDEDDDDDDDDDQHDHQQTNYNRQKFSIQEYKLKELQKPIVIHRSQLNPSIHSTESTTHSDDLISVSVNKLSLDHQNDESLLEKFASANTDSVPITIRSPPFRPPTANEMNLASQQCPQTIFEEDDTQESSTNDNVSDESADNGEIDLVHEFELSQQQQEQNKSNNTNLWSTNDRDIFILQEDDLLSAMVTTPTQISITNRPLPPSIMKMTQNKSIDSIDEQQIMTTNSLKPKVRFNLDPQYEREREWNKVTKILGNSVEWTDEFEV